MKSKKLPYKMRKKSAIEKQRVSKCVKKSLPKGREKNSQNKMAQIEKKVATYKVEGLAIKKVNNL